MFEISTGYAIVHPVSIDINLILPVFAIANLRSISLHAVRVCSIGPVFTF